MEVLSFYPIHKPEDIFPYVADANVVGLTAMTPTISVALSIAHRLKQANPDYTPQNIKINI